MKKLLAFIIILASTLFFVAYEDINIFKTGENIVINKGDAISNVFCINGDVEVNGTINENIVVLNGDLSLGRYSQVNGEIVVVGGKINRSKRAKLNNTATNLSEEQITNIVSSMQFACPKQGKVLPILMSLSSLLICMLAVIFFPKIIGGISFLTETSPWKTLGIGILSWVLILPIMIVFILSIFGILLLPLYFLVIAIVTFFGKVAIAQLIGKTAASKLRKTQLAITWETALGLIILWLLQLLPFFGGIINATVYCFALGAGVRYLPELRRLKK